VELVSVKGACFRMGAASAVKSGPEERPAHEVCLDDFQLGKYEVTQGQWKAVMGSNPSANAACGDDCPVEMVSWNDALEFIGKLNARVAREEGRPGNYRLPTEAEWEYAARSGGKDERYAGGDDVASVGWFIWNSSSWPAPDRPEQTHPVGQKAPNGLGFQDMTGNVWEWTADWYASDFYASSPRQNPAGPATGERRVVRGGGFGNDAYDCRTTYRNDLPPDYRGREKGFRLARGGAAPVAQPAPAPAPVATAATAAASAAKPPPIREPLTGMELVHVPGGCFTMGDLYDDGQSGSGDSEDEKPLHEVCLSPFYMGRFELTRAQWKAVMATEAASPETCAEPTCPVDTVGWDEAQAFLARLNAGGGPRYRLPTEAEWEYAARSGGRPERYSGGNDVDSVSWYGANSGYRADRDAILLHAGGAKLPNGLGLYDMSGNAYELTGDWYAADNPTGPATGAERVRRGGCASGHPGNSRAARRSQFGGAGGLTSLRLVREP
jgi:formylglycine-generating enzyme required for sulfatase activity